MEKGFAASCFNPLPFFTWQRSLFDPRTKFFLCALPKRSWRLVAVIAMVLGTYLTYRYKDQNPMKIVTVDVVKYEGLRPTFDKFNAKLGDKEG